MYALSDWNQTCSDLPKPRIQRENECIKASKSYGLSYLGAHTYANYPRGCFKNRNNHVYWNKHSTGSNYKDCQAVCFNGK